MLGIMHGGGGLVGLLPVHAGAVRHPLCSWGGDRLSLGVGAQQASDLRMEQGVVIHGMWEGGIQERAGLGEQCAG